MPKLGFVYHDHINSKSGINKLMPEQWAYIAGIFDGEGSLTSTRGEYYRVDIYQKNTNRLLLWLHQTLGAGSIASNQTVGVEVFRLLQAKQVYEFLTGILPYTIVKREKVIAAMTKLSEKYGFKV
jgi:hypothetical protein